MKSDQQAALGVADLRQALLGFGLADTVLEFETSTATSQQAAENVGCELGQIVKSLGFMINRTRPLLALTSGDRFIDERKLAALYNVGRKKARMMSGEQCLAILGYPPGAAPPICHRLPGIPVLLDINLRRYEIVYAGAGAANAIFRIELADLQRVTAGQFADIVKS